MFRTFSLLALATLLPAEEWTRFRGPNGTGITTDKGFPVEFGKEKNLLWRTPVRPGKSSPVLTKTRIFLTGFEEEKLYTMCFDRATGKLLWERSEPRLYKADTQKLNHPAAPSPVTDGENVYVFFKDYGVLAYDGNGKLLWRAVVPAPVNSQGLSASPILAGDLVVIQVDQMDNSYMSAYSKSNGELRWKVARDESESWATPILYQPAKGVPQIVAAGAGQLGAHRVSDGKRLFSYAEASPAMVASPVMSGDTIYAFGYGGDGPSPFSKPLARLDKNKDGVLTPDEYGTDSMLGGIGKYVGNGDGIVTEAKWDAFIKHVSGYTGLYAVQVENGAATRKLWSVDKGFQGVIPSPLVYDGIVYVIKNGGIFSAYDVKTGEVLKTARITGALGGYSSSPVLAEGRIYLSSEEGKISVVRPGRQWDVIQVNDIGDGFFATPALSGGRIYARGSDAIYCFGAGGK